jgi:hypothetical protein
MYLKYELIIKNRHAAPPVDAHPSVPPFFRASPFFTGSSFLAAAIEICAAFFATVIVFGAALNRSACLPLIDGQIGLRYLFFAFYRTHMKFAFPCWLISSRSRSVIFKFDFKYLQ